MSFDISETLDPDSQQLDAIELVSGPRIFEVESVSRGNADQPVQVHLVGFPRPWRPGKSMRRVLAAGWGNDASVWVGRKVELYFEPEVSFGKEKPGGTRIKRMSHIDKRLAVPLLVSRGKSATYIVEPLPDSPGAVDAPVASVGKPDQVAPASGVTPEQVAACESVPQLRKWYKAIEHEGARAAITARIKALETEALDG